MKQSLIIYLLFLFQLPVTYANGDPVLEIGEPSYIKAVGWGVASFLLCSLLAVKFLPIFKQKKKNNLQKKQKATVQNAGKNQKTKKDKTKGNRKNGHEPVTETVLVDKFLDELLRGKNPKYGDKKKIEKLKKKWSRNTDGPVRKPPYVPSHKEIKNLREQLKKEKVANDENEKKIKLYQQEIEEQKELTNSAEADLKAANTELSEINQELDTTNKKLDAATKKLGEVIPYAPYMDKYLSIIKCIYRFAVHQKDQMPKDSIFNTFLDNILYVNGKSVAVNPWFDQARKDDYLLKVLRLKNPTELLAVEKQAFFENVIRGRGFSMLNTISKLYVYSEIPEKYMAVRKKMEQEKIDLDRLKTIFEKINDFLVEEFNVLIFPGKLFEKITDEKEYTQNDFSFLCKHFTVAEIEKNVIYDLDFIGFRSTTDENKIIARSRVTYE